MQTCPPITDRPLTADQRLAVLDRIDEILELKYRSGSLGNFTDPLEEAVYILLSQQTREAGYQRVHRDLRARWRTWQAILDAPFDELVEVLRPAGFGSQRAAKLQGLLGAVAQSCAERGIPWITLDWLDSLSDADAEEYLKSLPGMGEKSARCVMHYALDRKTLAVDTHVRRILDRLGIVADRPGKVKHSDYDAVVPGRMAQRLHVNLIHHGRALCRSSKPRCGECPLISFCETGRALQQDLPGDRPVAVELFAGGGGLGEGFARAGFFTAIAVELDRNAAQTYRVNHPGTVVLEADATKVTGDQLVRLAPAAKHASAIIAGPPCQGYSAAGKRKADDARNNLYTAVIDRARELQPRFLVIENVPGMRAVEGHRYAETVLEDLEAAGYNAKDHLLRACDYGVPQLRRRLLFLGQLATHGSAPEAPPSSHCPGRYCEFKCDPPGSRCGREPAQTVHEALDGLPPLDHGQDAEYLELGPGLPPLLNGSTMKHGERVQAKIRAIRPGAGPISYRRLHDDLARTIVAGHRALPVHPTLHRTISVREAARIQGFRDDHVFAGPRSVQPLQVANAVPPPLGEAVANALLRCAEVSGEAPQPSLEPVAAPVSDVPRLVARRQGDAEPLPVAATA